MERFAARFALLVGRAGRLIAAAPHRLVGEPEPTPLEPDPDLATRPVARRRTNLVSWVTAGAIGLFALLAILVRTGLLAGPDLAVTTELQEPRGPLLLPLMVLISEPGFFPLSWLIPAGAAATLWVARLRVEAFFALMAAGGVSLLGFVLKLLVERPRPSGVGIVGAASGFSFPSGHTLLYVAFFGFLLYWVYSALRPSLTRSMLLIVLGALIVLIGPSRIFLGHHWASDVLASYALGLAYLLLMIRWYRSVRLVPRDRPPTRSTA